MAETFDSALYSYLREYDEYEIYNDAKPEIKRCGACGEENYVSDMNFEKDVQNYVCVPCLNSRDYEEAKSFIKPLNP